MRIRTIKPEFWSHPVMVRQDDATKLLALGLLNYADDAGYFYAEPKMVRAALRPLDECSTIIRASLGTLSQIGYIETIEHPTHGTLGRVVSFTSHQRVDRPAASKIRVIWPEEDSTNDRRIIDEGSSPEGKGTGNREQGKENTPKAPAAAEQSPSAPLEGGKEKKPDSTPTSPVSIAIAELFGRRLKTAWSDREIRKFKDGVRRNIITVEAMEKIARYYTAERAKGEEGRHRRDLQTFLNNFDGELDRAEAFCSNGANGHGPAPENKDYLKDWPAWLESKGIPFVEYQFAKPFHRDDFWKDRKATKA